MQYSHCVAGTSEIHDGKTNGGLEMTLMSFVVLLGISIVVTSVLHIGLKVRVRSDVMSFVATTVWAYVGAWLSMSMFGTWLPEIGHGGVAIIPAVLGSAAIIVVAVDFVKTLNAGRSA